MSGGSDMVKGPEQDSVTLLETIPFAHTFDPPKYKGLTGQLSRQRFDLSLIS